jgi:hypothetical protein
MSKLHVVEGPLRGKVFEVTELASIGRGEACAVRLDGVHISRVHARLERRGESMVIKDNGSRNGIYVNGLSVREAVLRPDDQVEVGEHVLVFDPTADPEKLPRAAASVLETLADPFAPGEPDERLQKLLGVAASVASMDSEKEIARALLEALMLAIPAERGFVMVQDEGGQLVPAARKAPAGEEEFFLSNVLSHPLSKERKALIARDVFRKQPSIGKPVGILAAPLASRSGVLGLVYLDARMAEGETRPRFTRPDLRFAAILAGFAGSRIAQIRRVAPLLKLGEKPLPDLRAAFEKECVIEALRLKKGDLEAASKFLGLTRATLDEKLKILGIVGASPLAPKGAAAARGGGEKATALKQASAAKPSETRPPEDKPPASPGWQSVQV